MQPFPPEVVLPLTWVRELEQAGEMKIPLMGAEARMILLLVVVEEETQLLPLRWERGVVVVDDKQQLLAGVAWDGQRPREEEEERKEPDRPHNFEQHLPGKRPEPPVS